MKYNGQQRYYVQSLLRFVKFRNAISSLSSTALTPCRLLVSYFASCFLFSLLFSFHYLFGLSRKLSCRFLTRKLRSHNVRSTFHYSRLVKALSDCVARSFVSNSLAVPRASERIDDACKTRPLVFFFTGSRRERTLSIGDTLHIFRYGVFDKLRNHYE